MSSLYRLLQKGKRVFPKLDSGFSRESWKDLNRVALHQAKPPDCILVNIQSVFDDFFIERAAQVSDPEFGVEQVPLVTPPFASMWFEFTLKYRNNPREQRIAVQCTRNPEPPEGYACELYYWCLQDGCIGGPFSVDAFLVGEGGSILEGTPHTFPVAILNEETTQAIGDITDVARWATLLSISRMNCKNCELRPINEGKFNPHGPNLVVPASVWHEIVITSVPKVRATGRDIFNERKDENEIRAHWIRGHYADYRKGAGLFGKIHGLFWIPEHRKGNEELGQVIPEYTIQ
jgi:hypothetical protein